MSNGSRGTRRTFTVAYKAQVALEAAREDRTMVELAMRFDVYPVDNS